MRQQEQDIGMVGTAGKPPSVNSTAGNTQVVSTLTTIDTTTSHHKTKPTPQDSFEESSVHEVENTTTRIVLLSFRVHDLLLDFDFDLLLLLSIHFLSKVIFKNY